MKRPPYASGPGYAVKPLKSSSSWNGEVWSLHVGFYRAWLVVDGPAVRFGAFGLRPGFYRKLERLRARRSP
jgi:hypothetical protein